MNEDRFTFLKHSTAISVAAVLDRVILHPVETVMSVQQKSDNYKPLFSVVKSIVRSDGFSGLYAGMARPLQFAVPYRLVMFSSYLFTKEYFTKKLNGNVLIASYFAGIASGFSEALTICPAENYRIQQIFKMDPGPNPYTIKIIYKGFFPLACRAMTSNTLTFAGSDLMLRHLPKKWSEDHKAPFVAGALAGAASQFFATPFDAWKTRVMSDTKNTPSIDHLKTLFREGSLFNSLKTRIVRNGSGNGIMIGTIHLVNKLFDSHVKQIKI